MRSQPWINRSTPVTEWGGSRPENYGLYELYTSLFVWEVPALPDFSTNRFTHLGSPETRFQEVAGRMAAFLDRLYQNQQRLAAAIRIVKQSGDSRLSAFLIVRLATDTPIAVSEYERLARTFNALLPDVYRFFYLGEDSGVAQDVAVSVARRKLALQIQPHAVTGFDVSKQVSLGTTQLPVERPGRYPQSEPWPPVEWPTHWFLPSSPWIPALGNDHLFGLCTALLQHPGWAMVEVALQSTQIIDVERSAINEEVDRLKATATALQRVDVTDANLNYALELFKKIHKGILDQSQNWWYYGIRVYTDGDHSETNALMRTLTATATQTKLRLAPLTKEHFARAEALDLFVNEVQVDLWQNGGLKSLYRFHKIAALSELRGFWALPIPMRTPFPGFDLDAGQRLTLRGDPVQDPDILLGEAGDGVVRIKLEELQKHMLIVGLPGSGKTTTVFHLLYHLREFGKPWIVLEPAKTEYRALRVLFPDVYVFTLGDELTVPFRFNPLEVPEGTPLERHISRLNACFVGAFNLFDPLPILLDRAIRELYREHGWSTYDRGGSDAPAAPLLADLHRVAVRVADEGGYSGEVASNIKAALLNRLESLLRGSIGRMMNTRASIGLPFLMQHNVVLEMDALNADEKALMMMFMFTHIYEYAKESRGSNMGLQHVLVLEEAHNLIGHGASTQSQERANPRQHAIDLFNNMLSEMRALGEAIIIADQLPSALAPQAMKNTGSKIVHQLTAGDDRSAISLTMGIAEDQKEYSEPVTFQPGEAFVFTPRETRPRRTSILPAKQLMDIKQIEPPKDRVLRFGDPNNLDFTPMRIFLAEHTDIFLPFDICTLYCSMCTPKVREWAEEGRSRFETEAVYALTPSLRDNKSDDVRKAVIQDIRATRWMELVDHYMVAIQEERDGKLAAFCALAHFLSNLPGGMPVDGQRYLTKITQGENYGT